MSIPVTSPGTNGAATTKPRRAMTVPDFMAAKARGVRLTVLTAYDYTMARLLDDAGVDAILVGDSLGMVMQGEPHAERIRAMSAPPWIRFHVVSTPSRRSFVAASPASSTNGSIREPSFTGGLPMPKPCVLCIPRLRAAIDANDSPDTGSRPPTSAFTTPGPSGTFAGAPATAMPAPGFAAAAPCPTLWTMRRACQGRGLEHPRWF